MVHSKRTVTGLMALVSALFLAFGPSSAFAGDAAAGKTVYDTNCSSCHGPEGKGDGPAGAALNPKPADLSTSALDEAGMVKIVTEGGAAVGKSPLMVAWKGTLNETQIADVVAHLRSLKK